MQRLTHRGRENTGRTAGRADLPATLVGRFRVLCLITTTAAFVQMITQVQGGWSAFVQIAQLYSVSILLLLAQVFVIYVFAQRLFNPYHRAIPAKAYYFGWHRDYIRTLRYSDAGIALSALVVTASSFTVFKTTEIGDQGYTFDPLLIAIDRILFGGVDPAVLTHALFTSPYATKIMEVFYYPTFLPVVVGYISCTFIRSRPDLRYTYIVSYLACFVLVGMAMAGAMDSAGPAFDGLLFGDGQTFAPVFERLRMHSEQVGPLWSTQTQIYLLDTYHNDRVEFGAGISAMPSMHIVFTALWTMVGWHLNRWLGILMTVYLGIIWLASVHLAWHYFTDGLVAVAMVLVVWYCVGRAFGLFPRRAGTSDRP